MKKVVGLMIGLGLLFVLSACGSTNEKPYTSPVENNSGESEADKENNIDVNKENDQDEGATEVEPEVNTQEDMKGKMDDLPYTEFSLEVEYSDRSEYEAELEYDDGFIDVEVEDSVLGKGKLKDEAAFNELYPKVKALTITQQTPKEDAIQEVLKVFELNADYTKFELEIKFNDDTKIEFKDRK